MGSLAEDVVKLVSLTQDPGNFPHDVNVFLVLIWLVRRIGGSSSFLGRTNFQDRLELACLVLPRAVAHILVGWVEPLRLNVAGINCVILFALV